MSFSDQLLFTLSGLHKQPTVCRMKVQKLVFNDLQLLPMI